MKRHHCSLLLAFIALGLSAMALVEPAVAQRYDFLPRPSQPVLDQGEFLSGTEQRRLSQKLTAFEDTTSTAIVVVTVPSLNGAPISDYAISLGREWGVGQEDKDNGVVVLVSREDRQMFIATGYGVEGALPDAVANRIVDQIITPAFRQGHFYAGLDRGTDAIIQATQGEFTADQTRSQSSEDGPSTALLFILMILIYFVASSFRGRGRGKGARKSRRRHGGMPVVIWGGGSSRGGGGFSGGGGFGGFGGGSFGGGGAGGSW